MQLEKLTQKELEDLYRDQKCIDLPYLHFDIVRGVLLLLMSATMMYFMSMMSSSLPIPAIILIGVVGIVTFAWGGFSIFDYIHKLPEIKNTYKKACDTVDAIEKEIANRHIFYLHYRT